MVKGCCSLVILTAMLLSCKQTNEKSRIEAQTSGTAQILCDEGFFRVLKEEIEVFEAQHPEAELHPVVTNEQDMMRLLLSDSIRLAFGYRNLTKEEEAIIKSHKRILRTQKIAIEGVALIINKKNTDSLISTQAITDILTGKIVSWNEINPSVKSRNTDTIQVVFDNPKSSTVRYLTDSLTSGMSLSPSLRALKNSKEVLDYVSGHVNALGVIGVSWISNPEDTLNLTFDDKIRVMSVSTHHPAFADQSYKPYPAYLGLGIYPLQRDVYRILTDQKYSVSSGFASFVGGDTGQRIILRAGLVPGTRPSRIISLKDEF